MWSNLLLIAAILVPLILIYRLIRRVRSIRAREKEGVRCPICGVRSAWKSRPRFPDGIYAVFYCVAYRCGGCGVRFYVYSYPGRSDATAQ